MYLILSLCLFFLQTVHAQKDKVYQGLILDEVMVKAVAGGFDVDGFIQKVKNLKIDKIKQLKIIYK